MSSTNLTDFRNQYLTRTKLRLTAIDLSTADDKALIVASALLRGYDSVNRFDAIVPEAISSLESMTWPELNTYLQDASNRQAFEQILSSQEAMKAIAASGAAMASIALCSIAMTAIAANSVAMTAITASSVAMGAVSSSSLAMTAVAASNVAMTALVASNLAMNAVGSNGASMTALSINSTAVATILASSQAMSIMGARTFASAQMIGGIIGLPQFTYMDMASLAASATAMAAVVTSATATAVMAASTTAMAAVAASTTAMAAVTASATAMASVAASAAAMAGIAASATSMTAIVSSPAAMAAVVASNVAVDAIFNSSVSRLALYNSDAFLAAFQANPVQVQRQITLRGVYATTNAASFTYVPNGTKVILMRVWTTGNPDDLSLRWGRGLTTDDVAGGVRLPNGDNLGSSSQAIGRTTIYSNSGVYPNADNTNANVVSAANGLRRGTWSIYGNTQQNVVYIPVQ